MYADNLHLKFVKIFIMTAHKQASDPRDMICGLLDLAPDGVAQQIEASYDLSVRDIDIQTTWVLTKDIGTLLLLSRLPCSPF